MTTSNTKLTNKNEKGIALIFTLIMLSLMMILAMSFALDSMFSQKAAYNSASASSSGFMGQAQLNQVFLLMKKEQANFSGSRLYSHDFYGNTDTDMLIDRLPVDGVLASDDGVLNPTVKVNWNYTKNADGEIIGRTAFVVIPEDKIPFDSLVSKTLAEQSFGETRIGKKVSEINIFGTGVTGSRGLSDIAKIITPLNWTDQSGKYTGLWASFNKMFEEINDNLTTDLTDTEKDVFEQRLSISVDKTKEVFWANLSGSTNSDTKKDSGEFYNRFNLARTDWDKTSNVDDIKFIKEEILLTQNASSSLDMDMDAWSVSVTPNDGHGLPWLACFGYKSDGTEDAGLAGTFASVKDRRYQIAANLKDYCDSDNYPTSDIDPRGTASTNWKNSATPPTYTGNEKTPYIDKLGVCITAHTVKEYDDTTTTTSDGWLHSTIEIIPCAGLIDMYGTGCVDKLFVYVDMDVSFTSKVNSTTVTIPTQNVKLTINIASGTWDSSYTNSAFAGGSTSYPTTKVPVDPVDSAEMTLTVTDIKINKAVLYRDTALGGDADCYDYVKSLNETTAIPLFDKVTGDNSVDYLMGWAVHDARQNLNAGDWQLLSGKYVDQYQPDEVFSYELSFPYYVGRPNSKNSTLGGGGVDTEKPNIEQTTPTGNIDLETDVTDSANYGISTAHIRNLPMESPWELGFIHRGKKWQTINLKAYDTSKAYQVTKIPATTGKDYILGGGIYSSGDANILDQIKMSSDTKTLQKIALDTKNDDPSFTIMALVSQIYYGCNVDSVMSMNSMVKTGGTKLAYNGTDTTALCTAIKSYYDSAINPENRLTRASVVSQLLLSATSTPAIVSPTDAQQEELIGKIINLTKIAGSDGNFTIIVLAQTIKDIDSGGASITKYASDGTTSGSQACTFGTFDFIDNGSIKTSVYFDEITGQQKIMVKGNISNGTLTIKSFQYVE